MSDTKSKGEAFCSMPSGFAENMPIMECAASDMILPIISGLPFFAIIYIIQHVGRYIRLSTLPFSQSRQLRIQQFLGAVVDGASGKILPLCRGKILPRHPHGRRHDIGCLQQPVGQFHFGGKQVRRSRRFTMAGLGVQLPDPLRVVLKRRAVTARPHHRAFLEALLCLSHLQYTLQSLHPPSHGANISHS
ncbi:hypothetical protein [Parasphingorhabdus sp.]|uniref:hypothetical protein n=1 Tax=Parasphingorhabdus sp. TaxID=2709688 RepID=UPI0030019D17